MLDVMRKHSRSFIIYILFGIIIAVFVINFGPQSAGCAAPVSYAGKVEGSVITPKLLAYAFSVSRVNTQPVPEAEMVLLRARVVDQLVLRELLAEDALKLGFRIPAQEIEDMLLKGRFLGLGQPQPLYRNDKGEFDYDLFSRQVRYSWGLTVQKFKEDQERELLAEKMRNFFRASIKVSTDEVRSSFVQQNTQAQLQYVRFAPSEFRAQVKIDDAKVQAHLAANRARVKSYYEENKTAYQKLPKQVRLQIIRVDAAESNATARAAGRKKIDDALARLKAGKDFGEVAAEISDDKETRAAGGLVGWRNEDSPGVGEAAQKEVPRLKAGETSAVLADKEGFVVVRVLGRRQGDLSLEQAQAEIAEEQLRTEEALRLAREAASGFHARLKAGAKLTELFPVEEKPEEEKQGPDGAQPASAPVPALNQSPFRIATTASFPRSAQHLIPGIGVSKELMDDVFKLKKGELAGRVYTVDQAIYLVQVLDRTEPDWGEWARREQDLVEEYQVKKFATLFQAYAYARCDAAAQAKRVHVEQKALVTPGYVQPKNEPELPGYTPCASLKPEPL